MSIVAFSRCQAGFRQNSSYKQMSSQMYSATYPDGRSLPTDQSGNSNPDSYDICTNNFTSIFTGINNSIKHQTLHHEYDHWPIASPGSEAFDPSSIVVRRKNGQVIPKKTPSSSDGFLYVTNPATNNIVTRNTRYAPTPGEPFQGHMIQLFGNARVKHPDCITIETNSPLEYFGYVKINVKPLDGTIKLKINGQEVPESPTNGWQYIGYKQVQNVKVQSPSHPIPVNPPLEKTGYFLKLSGSAIYSSGDTIQTSYIPASASSENSNN